MNIAEQVYKKGLECYDKGDYSQAIIYFRQAADGYKFLI